MRGRIAAVALVVPLLAGCGSLPFDLPSGANLPSGVNLPSVGKTTAAPGSVTCEHGIQYTLNDPGNYTLSGNCDLVSIAGDRIMVTSSEGFGALSIEGSNNSVTAKDTGAVTAEGNNNVLALGSVGVLNLEGRDNKITLTKAGGLNISGDANTIQADELGGVNVNGNRNTVHATKIGPTNANGTGNDITEA